MSESAVDTVSQAEAEAAVRTAEASFGSADVRAMLACFTEDCVVRFGEQPEISGLDALERFLRARMARQRDYGLRKTLRAVQGNVIGVEWHGWWQDARTGSKMEGKGLEFWTMRDGKIAVWDAAFNVWEKDGPRVSPVT
jgi:nuclear transport factor 2 (NTF2) superfamily protein